MTSNEEKRIYPTLSELPWDARKLAVDRCEFVVYTIRGLYLFKSRRVRGRCPKVSAVTRHSLLY